MESCDGIVLSSIKFKENERIVALFSKEAGIVQMIAKGLSQKNMNHAQLVSPMCYGRYCFAPGRGSLLRFRDGTVHDLFLPLREDLDRLEAAMRLLKAIDKTQMPGKEAPMLFALLKVYLGALCEGNPMAVEASFYLKLLKHEGLLSEMPMCGVCKRPPTHLGKGERFCETHAPVEAIGFSGEQFRLLDALLGTRELAKLTALPVDDELLARVTGYFASAF